MNDTIKQLESLLNYNEEIEAFLRKYNIIKKFYNPETRQYEDLTLKEIIKKYPNSEIRNITGSSNKARIMAIMQQNK
jgi:hypothetical protein